MRGQVVTEVLQRRHLIMVRLIDASVRFLMLFSIASVSEILHNALEITEACQCEEGCAACECILYCHVSYLKYAS